MAARLLREARAIARLSHPNVIAVHDIGLHGDQPFVAMELVEGSTLRSWLAASPRSWRDIVAVFVAAERGLLAAHRAGLVHRDFKPDNVLIGHDGRIRVTDFGLACPLPGLDRDGSDGPAPEAPAELGALAPCVEDRQELVGTPGSIAPEVLRGGAADFAIDQFSFCVALHEALFWERPLLRASSLPARVEVPRAVQTSPGRKPAARGRGDVHAETIFSGSGSISRHSYALTFGPRACSASIYRALPLPLPGGAGRSLPVVASRDRVRPKPAHGSMAPSAN